MSIDLSRYLTVAVRAWTTPAPSARRRSRRRRRRRVGWRPVQHVLVIDTETTVDSAQGLLFGAFRYCRLDDTTVTTVAEGLIYADDLAERDPAGLDLLRRYAASRKPDVDLTYLPVEPCWALQLVSRAEFVDGWLYRVGYRHGRRRDPAMVVMFNAPFDLSRLAVDVAEARGDLHGGFSFTVWTDEHGQPAPWRPRVAVKAIDSKRAIKKFRRREREAGDFAGHLLDLRTLVFALTGESHGLASGCAAFGVPGKAATPDLGVISEAAVDYCRQDVAATTSLLEAVLAEYARHPIDLQPTRAYSPASIAKGYLPAMGIQPRLTRQPDFPADVLGYAMSAFYGGRAEAHLRHLPIPVTLVDFTSMYPTVDILLGLWPLVTADRVEAVEVTDEVDRLLATITMEDLFRPQRWRDLVVIAQVIPDGDILPVRADYRPQDWSIAVNPLFAERPLWYTLPDLIASKLLSGRTPTVLRALRFVPVGGSQPDLVPTTLRGEVLVDPRSEDFFQRVVEARQEIKRRVPDHKHGSCLCGNCRLHRFLKVLANAGSYGIYAEMIRHELASGSHEQVTVHGPSGRPFTCQVSAPETPGEYCFPPIAACITGAARLMLALLERAVTDAGGSWAFCDTDSMAIVTTDTGGLLGCPGGDQQLPDGTPAIRALSFEQVDGIRRRFAALNPYDPAAVPDLLKLERTGTCYAISAKRYVIYDRLPDGSIRIVKRSLHGLGRYLDPVSPREERRDADGNLIWVDEAWRWVLAVHNIPDTPLPDWACLPALSRITVSSPPLWRPFARWNHRRRWPEQIKPFNFLLVATVDPFGYPPGADPARFRLVAPYTDNPEEWDRLPWRNLYDPDGPTYRITTDRDAPASPDLVVVKSYANVLRDYRLHPEHKFHGPDGTPCQRLTHGVLQRRPVQLAGPVRHIGKEANRLDDVHAGLVSNLGEVLTEYEDPEAERLHAYVLPVLDRYSGRELARLVDTDRRTIDRIRRGGPPRAPHLAALVELALAEARNDLERVGELPPTSKIEPPERGTGLLAAWRQRFNSFANIDGLQ